MYRLGDLDFMSEALRLAAEGTALASPNPRVGAVVVRESQVIGRGWHRYEDRTHAEVLALAEAGEAARGASLYVNLEPCSHTGRTPPCVEAILAAGITRVIAGMEDPNPSVAGQGLRRLAEAGVAVECGCLGREAERLNQDFSKWIRTGLPWVTIKSAISLDGRIAPAGSAERCGAQQQWISSAPSRERVQQLRHAADAVLTGIGTALSDDPLLTDRTKLPRRRRLLRVVLDSHLRLPVESKLVQTARRRHDLLVLHSQGSEERAALLTKAGATVERVACDAADAGGRVDVGSVLRRLGALEILSVLVEAGARVNGAVLAGGWADRLVLFQSPRLLGGEGVPLAAGTLDLRLAEALAAESIGPDLMIDANLRN